MWCAVHPAPTASLCICRLPSGRILNFGAVLLRSQPPMGAHHTHTIPYHTTPYRTMPACLLHRIGPGCCPMCPALGFVSTAALCPASPEKKSIMSVAGTLLKYYSIDVADTHTWVSRTCNCIPRIIIIIRTICTQLGSVFVFLLPWGTAQAPPSRHVDVCVCVCVPTLVCIYA